MTGKNFYSLKTQGSGKDVNKLNKLVKYWQTYD